MEKTTTDLSVRIAGMTLRNPVMTASGTFGYGGEFRELVDLKRLGAIIVKGLSLEPSHGNPPPRQNRKTIYRIFKICFRIKLYLLDSQPL